MIAIFDGNNHSTLHGSGSSVTTRGQSMQYLGENEASKHGPQNGDFLYPLRLGFSKGPRYVFYMNNDNRVEGVSMRAILQKVFAPQDRIENVQGVSFGSIDNGTLKTFNFSGNEGA